MATGHQPQLCLHGLSPEIAVRAAAAASLWSRADVRQTSSGVRDCRQTVHVPWRRERFRLVHLPPLLIADVEEAVMPLSGASADRSAAGGSDTVPPLSTSFWTRRRDFGRAETVSLDSADDVPATSAAQGSGSIVGSSAAQKAAAHDSGCLSDPDVRPQQATKAVTTCKHFPKFRLGGPKRDKSLSESSRRHSDKSVSPKTKARRVDRLREFTERLRNADLKWNRDERVPSTSPPPSVSSLDSRRPPSGATIPEEVPSQPPRRHRRKVYSTSQSLQEEGHQDPTDSFKRAIFKIGSTSPTPERPVSMHESLLTKCRTEEDTESASTSISSAEAPAVLSQSTSFRVPGSSGHFYNQPRTIPFRSASFSRVESCPAGAGTRSSNSPITIQPVYFSINKPSARSNQTAQTLPKRVPSASMDAVHPVHARHSSDSIVDFSRCARVDDVSDELEASETDALQLEALLKEINRGTSSFIGRVPSEEAVMPKENDEVSKFTAHKVERYDGMDHNKTLLKLDKTHVEDQGAIISPVVSCEASGTIASAKDFPMPAERPEESYSLSAVSLLAADSASRCNETMPTDVQGNGRAAAENSGVSEPSRVSDLIHHSTSQPSLTSANNHCQSVSGQTQIDIPFQSSAVGVSESQQPLQGGGSAPTKDKVIDGVQFDRSLGNVAISEGNVELGGDLLRVTLSNDTELSSALYEVRPDQRGLETTSKANRYDETTETPVRDFQCHEDPQGVDISTVKTDRGHQLLIRQARIDELPMNLDEIAETESYEVATVHQGLRQAVKMAVETLLSEVNDDDEQHELITMPAVVDGGCEVAQLLVEVREDAEGLSEDDVLALSTSKQLLGDPQRHADQPREGSPETPPPYSARSVSNRMKLAEIGKTQPLSSSATFYPKAKSLSPTHFSSPNLASEFPVSLEVDRYSTQHSVTAKSRSLDHNQRSLEIPAYLDATTKSTERKRSFKQRRADHPKLCLGPSNDSISSTSSEENRFNLRAKNLTKDHQRAKLEKGRGKLHSTRTRVAGGDASRPRSSQQLQPPEQLLTLEEDPVGYRSGGRRNASPSLLSYDSDLERMPRSPQTGRRRLRGPYGEMLEGKMSRSDSYRSRDDEHHRLLTALTESASPSPAAASPARQEHSASGDERARPPPIGDPLAVTSDTELLDLDTVDPPELSRLSELLDTRYYDDFAPTAGSIISQLTSEEANQLKSQPRKRGRRLFIIGELVDTEQFYVESMRLLMNYYQQFRRPELSSLIDPGALLDIFHMIPDILKIHEDFLRELKHRIKNWSNSQCIADVFIDKLSGPAVLDTYSGFISNWPSARAALRRQCQSKPGLGKFLESLERSHKRKLSFTHLLIMPVQRIPRYELLLKQLVNHTADDHVEADILPVALAEVRQLASRINGLQRKTVQLEGRQQALRDVEAAVDGLDGLESPDRLFIRHDLVTMTTALGTKKERVLLLFNDVLVIASVKRRAGTARKPFSYLSDGSSVGLEANKYKMLMKLPLADLNVVRTKDENLNSLLKEAEKIEEDICTLRDIGVLVCKLNCNHHQVEELVREMANVLNRQLTERQRADNQLMQLQLNVTTQEGLETVSMNFCEVERRSGWEQAFNECKQKLAVCTVDHRPAPEFAGPIPIRKTRAGLQFSCVAATLSPNDQRRRDIWACNSDGYVGQICVLSLCPEPTVTSCNGVCNSRILCIAAVPSISVGESTGNASSIRSKETEPRHETLTSYDNDSATSQPSQLAAAEDEAARDIQLDSSSDAEGSSDEEGLSFSAAPPTEPHHPAPESHRSAPESHHPAHGSHHPAHGSDHPAPESHHPASGSHHPASGSHHPAHESHHSAPESHRFVPPFGAGQATMWLGTEDGCLYVYNCDDYVRIKKTKVKVQLGAAVQAVVYHNGRVYVALATGTVNMYRRDPGLAWDIQNPRVLQVSSSCIDKLSLVSGMLWACSQNVVKIVDPNSFSVQDTVVLGGDSHTRVQALVQSGLGVWLSFHSQPIVRLLHRLSYELVCELDITAAVSQMLSGCDDIIRQHKTACLRVTALLCCRDLLWVGTSAGLLLTLPQPLLSDSVSSSVHMTSLASTPSITGIYHGHTGHVRFLTCVEPGHDLTSTSTRYRHGRASVKVKDKSQHQGACNSPGQLLVISGGDGYEDFRSTASELTGRDDSTNHLLIWRV